MLINKYKHMTEIKNQESKNSNLEKVVSTLFLMVFLGTILFSAYLFSTCSGEACLGAILSVFYGFIIIAISTIILIIFKLFNRKKP